MNKLTTFLTTLLASFIFVPAAFAAQAGSMDNGLVALASGIGMGIAALGGAAAQGRAVAAALESIGRNPGAAGKIQTPMILGLALIESLVIFTFVITILLSQKVG